MDVGCPKCQSEYELDDARVTEEGVTVKCTSCAHVFRVKKKQLVVTLPVKADSPAPTSLGTPSGELPPPPPSREWKIRQPSGNVFPCRDLTMLQKWIIEGKVQRDDEISLTGETWKRLGNIPELASFFQIVDEAAKARAFEALQRTTPPPPPAPSAPPAGQRITDTWRGGQFAASPPPPEVETPPPPPPPSVPDPVPAPVPKRSSQPLPVAPAPVATPRSTRAAPPPSKKFEPSEEDLRRAVKGGSGSGRWLVLVLAGLGVGGGVGWYYGVYQPEQLRLAEEASRPPTPEVPQVATPDAATVTEVVVDAGPGVEPVDAGAVVPEPVDAGAPEPLDAGDPAAAAKPKVPAPVVVEQKKSFDWYVAQGDRLRDREKAADALDFYAKASELKPDRIEPIVGKGLALLDMANPTGAIASFQEALTHAPRYGPAIMGIAEAYRMQGNTEKAIEFYQRYLDVLPNGIEAPVARNSLERLKK